MPAPLAHSVADLQTAGHDDLNQRERRISTFARRGGRKLSNRQAGLIEHLLPEIAVPDAGPATLDPATLFGESAVEVWLEIGFGGAEHLVEQARRNRDVGIIGCEPFMDGVAKALTVIDEQGLGNLRLHMDDARDVIDRLEPACLSRVFILFPDPWPKKRQQKRRLVQPEFLAELARSLRPQAQVRFATDVRSYADDALCAFLEDGRYHWQAAKADDWRTPPADHVRTRYESKRLGDIAPAWFDFLYSPG